MKALVTGGAGFIGSHLVDLLLNNKTDVIVVDNISTGKLENLSSKAKFHKIDICDENMLNSIFSAECPDIVFHLAAQVDVIRSISEPQLDAEVNIIGSLNLLEMCRKHKVKKIIYSNSGGAGSGEPQYFPIDENHPIEPMSHYGVSKHTVEHYLKIYKDLYGIEFTSLRYANIYGPRQDPFGEGGVVAIFSNKLLNHERPNIFGDGKQTRDFMFVKDIAMINLLCIDKADGQILNIGTGTETSVNDLFFMIRNIVDVDLEPVYCKERKGEIRKSVFDVRKMRELLLNTTVDLKEGLKETIEFFK